MKIDTNRAPHEPVREIEDNGKVRIGATSPSFPPARATPACTKDGDKFRIGATSPSFPPAR